MEEISKFADFGKQPTKIGSKDNRVQLVFDELIKIIESYSLEIGDRLPPEIELAKQIGVGRSTIREALKTWQNLGIITRNKGGGTVLSAEVSLRSISVPLPVKFEAESLRRTHAVRRPLEIEANRLAALNASALDRKIILSKAADLMVIFESGKDWRPADFAFHKAIHDSVGNPLFGQFIEQLYHAFHDVYETPFGNPNLGRDTIPMHQPLAECIADGDADGAQQITIAIKDIVDREILEVMRLELE